MCLENRSSGRAGCAPRISEGPKRAPSHPPNAVRRVHVLSGPQLPLTVTTDV